MVTSDVIYVSMASYEDCPTSKKLFSGKEESKKEEHA